MKSQIVSFRCVLRNKLGHVLSSTINHDVITGMTASALDGAELPGLVEGLVDLKTGERRKISISAERAYGLYDPDLVLEVSRKKLAGGARVKVGDLVRTRCRKGRMRLFHVTQAGASAVLLDANHPLAGQDLIFDIEAVEVRDATSEEVRESFAVPAPGRLIH
ncbi:MAG: FKBP-type peptidyl-prolyl cis-trans isomerase [Oligoflexia bacterium]|nr:FKBP-type peptidyl-prolyl cis-trans isomerase [Oligoflexia bacterium]